MSLALSARPRRRQGIAVRIGSIVLPTLLLIWTLFPLYNILLIALSADGDEFSGEIWPEDWNWRSFQVIWEQGNEYFANFWHQFGNSLLLGLSCMVVTMLIGSLAAFVLGRMRLRHAWIVSDVALTTYALPSAFLAIPFVYLMRVYGLSDTLWGVAASVVAFATPYAILILHQYGKLIPVELDDAARIDGANPLQVYLRIYVPMMAPALVAVGVFALLLAWNEYLYQFLLLTSSGDATAALIINDFFIADEAPWNEMMALAMIYALPPIVIFLALRRFMVTGLTQGALK